MAPQKPRCTFKECKSAAQRIVGDCGFCDGHFCAKHRLLEDHKCSGLEDVSMNPTPPSSSSTDDSATTEWWLVGLAEYLAESGLDKECCGSPVLTSVPDRSARRNRTSVTRPSSSRNEHRSSGVYKRRSARSAFSTAHRRCTRPGRLPPRFDHPTSKSDSTTTPTTITHP
ncbi:hypothetical protein F4781DRAFT_427587 [Annulohypoxylon bovei var. microspora]|nr:hypothetical protein F4781DRAFT_427587 [Annulohypoxylon bovei var. microspora]